VCGRNVICADADCKVVEGGKDFRSRGTQRLDVRQCTGWGPPLTFHMGVVTWSAESEEGVERVWRVGKHLASHRRKLQSVECGTKVWRFL
jgi:hypothetical protein